MRRGRRGLQVLLLVGVISGSGATFALLDDALAPLPPPPTERVPHVDVLHGVPVADPYRWLEAQDDPRVAEWVAAQNRHSARHLATMPQRDWFARRLAALWQQPLWGLPERVDGALFATYTDGQRNQPVLTRRVGDAPPETVLDPNVWSADGTAALAQWQVSPDGQLLAYARSDAGSDWQVIEVIRLADGSRVSGPLRWVKFSGLSWLPDSTGLLYSRYPEPDDAAPGAALSDQGLYVHRLGTPQADDRLVYAQLDHPDHGFHGEVTEDGRYLVVSVWLGAASENAVIVQPLADDTPVWDAGAAIELVADFRARYALVGNQGSQLYFLTTDAAPRGRLVRFDLDYPSRGWQPVIDEQADTLQTVVRAGDHWVAQYLHHAAHRLAVHALNGQRRRDLALPATGSVTGLHGRAAADTLDLVFTAYNRPPVVLSTALDTPAPKLHPLFDETLAFAPDDFTTEQVFAESRDGTRVPLFLSYRRDLGRSGPVPLHLTAYGGFNVSLTPRFSPAALAWMEAGGVYVVANLRGGGEYGRDWHRAGIGARKQNVFNDFIAAAGYLIDREWTTAAQLAISGYSNGGLLVGAVLNQQPRLFGAAVAGVGVMDMLRFHRFTIGHAWTGDYGSPEEPDDIVHLRAISPYHNIEAGARYPPVMVTTADHDDRVVPAHSYKYTAALQAAQGSAGPVLLRVETDGGHGAGRPLTRRIEQAADEMGFLAHQVGLQPGDAAP